MHMTQLQTNTKSPSNPWQIFSNLFLSPSLETYNFFRLFFALISRALTILGNPWDSLLAFFSLFCRFRFVACFGFTWMNNQARCTWNAVKVWRRISGKTREIFSSSWFDNSHQEKKEPKCQISLTVFVNVHDFFIPSLFLIYSLKQNKFVDFFLGKQPKIFHLRN